MPAKPSTPTTRPSTGSPRAVENVPIDAQHEPRLRRRRGGPRTPLPLLPVIGICAGIGIAYVSQTAHGTQATYQASSLAAEHAQLQDQDRKITDELGRLRASPRIAQAASGLGMRPATRWAYVAAAPQPVNVPRERVADGSPPPDDGVQRLLAALDESSGAARR